MAVLHLAAHSTGLEQDLGVQNIQGGLIVHLRMRIIVLKEKSQGFEAPSFQSTEQLVSSQDFVEAHGDVHIS